MSCVQRANDLQGNSVIMYRNAEMREYQYYVQTGWAGGLYASPSIAGSRYVIRHVNS